jgi:hypothetical protein
MATRIKMVKICFYTSGALAMEAIQHAKPDLSGAHMAVNFAFFGTSTNRRKNV